MIIFVVLAGLALGLGLLCDFLGLRVRRLPTLIDGFQARGQGFLNTTGRRLRRTRTGAGARAVVFYNCKTY